MVGLHSWENEDTKEKGPGRSSQGTPTPTTIETPSRWGSPVPLQGSQEPALGTQARLSLCPGEWPCGLPWRSCSLDLSIMIHAPLSIRSKDRPGRLRPVWTRLGDHLVCSSCPIFKWVSEYSKLQNSIKIWLCVCTQPQKAHTRMLLSIICRQATCSV